MFHCAREVGHSDPWRLVRPRLRALTAEVRSTGALTRFDLVL